MTRRGPGRSYKVAAAVVRVDWTQALYIGLLAIALILGKPGWQIAGAMVVDLAGTMAFAPDPIKVAVVDLSVAAWLFGEGQRRATILAGLFITMVTVEGFAVVFKLQNAATYTIVDLLAYVQLGVIGGADRGMGRIVRAGSRRLRGLRLALAFRGQPGIGLARDQAQDGGGLNGR